ncbi:hypothetical protein ACFVXG_45595 [Kitasatospora sp. NPDC058162]|uniref:hypothetical protein n=1 Tax=Kitasatospora sp. NPDC058162 TaxID=3346362 RepID=UPI0036DAFCF8
MTIEGDWERGENGRECAGKSADENSEFTESRKITKIRVTEKCERRKLDFAEKWR